MPWHIQLSPPSSIRAFILSGILTGLGHAETMPLPFLDIQEYVTDLSDPQDLQSTPAFPNRVFVVESGGTIRVVESGLLLPTPFLQVPDVYALGESGLLGLTFPPGPAAASRCYVHYNRTNESGRVLTVISRFEIDPATGLADPLAESVLLETELNHHRHKGGQIAFGPDGCLYVGIGDTVNALSAQDRSTLSGKIIRIDPEGAPAGTPYLIPPGNPPTTDPAHRPEVLFLGLRNPRHFSFHPESGDLFICDIGQYQRHEINFVAAEDIDRGGNFGWPYMEGSADYLPNPPATESFLPPTYDYASSETKRITGGLLLNVGPARLQNLYIFGDLKYGVIRCLTNDSVAGWTATELLDTDAAISCFGADQSGNMLFADDDTGTIYRIIPRDRPDPPVPTRNSGTYATTGTYEVSFRSPVLETEIRYTLDGTDPSDGGILLPPGESVAIDHPVTLRARCFRQDLTPSELVERVFNLAPIPPEVTLLGPSNDNVDVSITATTSNCNIHYTTDGSTPTESSLLYTSPFRIASSLTIHATAFRVGWSPSITTTRNVHLQVSPPTRQTSLGLHEPMHLSSATTGATIHYKPLGTTEPSTYTAPIHDFQTYKWHTIASKGDLQTSTSLIDAIRLDPRRVTVHQIAPSGNPRETSGPTSTTPIGYPGVVAAKPDGTIFAASPRLYDSRWMLSGGQSTRIYDNGNAYGLIRLDSLGRLHIGLGSKILLLDPPYDAVTTEILIPDLPGMNDFVVEPDGSYVIAVEGHIYRYAEETGIVTLAGYDGFGDTPLEGPADSIRLGNFGGMARLPNGDYVFSEHGLDMIRKLTPDGLIKVVAGGTTSGHRDGDPGSTMLKGGGLVTADAIGNVYFTNGTLAFNAVRKIAPDGTVSTLSGPLVHATTLEEINPEYSLSIHDMAVADAGRLVLAGHTYGLHILEQQDWDNDLIPDDQERALGAPFTVGIDDRLVDTDLDNHSNTAELLSGTNPSDPGEAPRNGSLHRRGGFFYATIPVTPGIPHQVEFSPDGLTWHPMGTPFSPVFESVTRRDQASSVLRFRLYRAVPAH